MNSHEQRFRERGPLGPVFRLEPMRLTIPPRMARRLRCLAHESEGHSVHDVAIVALAYGITKNYEKAAELVRADRRSVGSGPGARVVRLRPPR